MKTRLVIHEASELIEAGFYKYEKVLDTKALLQSYSDGQYLELINKYCSLETIESKDTNKERST